MLYLIGLGLNLKSISREGMIIAGRCKKIYLENYTVDFPYPLEDLEELFDKKLIRANREFIESEKIVDEAKKLDIALLIYGSPLTATTHISLVQEAKRSGTKVKVIYAGSILDAIGNTGLQIYKFGKITSMPMWVPAQNFTPDSFMEIVKENQKIDAHTLILIDIGLRIKYAIEQLEESAKKHSIKLGKIVVAEGLGTDRERIFYRSPQEFIERGINVKSPYSIIVPAKLHFMEKEFLNELEDMQ